MKLKALKQFLFGKEVLEVGASFVTTAPHGQDLIKVGLAELNEADGTSQDETAEAAAAKAGKSKKAK